MIHKFHLTEKGELKIYRAKFNLEKFKNLNEEDHESQLKLLKRASVEPKIISGKICRLSSLYISQPQEMLFSEKLMRRDKQMYTDFVAMKIYHLFIECFDIILKNFLIELIEDQFGNLLIFNCDIYDMEINQKLNRNFQKNTMLNQSSLSSSSSMSYERSNHKFKMISLIKSNYKIREDNNNISNKTRNFRRMQSVSNYGKYKSKIKFLETEKNLRFVKVINVLNNGKKIFHRSCSTTKKKKPSFIELIEANNLSYSNKKYKLNLSMENKRGNPPSKQKSYFHKIKNKNFKNILKKYYQQNTNQLININSLTNKYNQFPKNLYQKHDFSKKKLLTYQKNKSRNSLDKNATPKIKKNVWEWNPNNKDINLNPSPKGLNKKKELKPPNETILKIVKPLNHCIKYDKKQYKISNLLYDNNFKN